MKEEFKSILRQHLHNEVPVWEGDEFVTDHLNFCVRLSGVFYDPDCVSVSVVEKIGGDEIVHEIHNVKLAVVDAHTLQFTIKIEWRGNAIAGVDGESGDVYTCKMSTVSLSG